MNFTEKFKHIVVTGSLDGVPSDLPIIATHSGLFHCDEIFAVSLLKKLPEYKDAIILRTRNMELLQKANIVVDVGYVFDPSTLRFDHHQKGFNEYFDIESRTVTKMSSIGLIYKYFGKRLLHEVYGIPANAVEKLYMKLYLFLIESIDALDNGVDICPHGQALFQHSTALTFRISRQNASPFEKLCYDTIASVNFAKCMDICIQEFEESLEYLYNTWYKAGEVINEGYLKRRENHESGRIMCIPSNLKYIDFLLENEEKGMSEEEKTDIKHPNRIFFIVYQSSANDWRVMTVINSILSFESRLTIPEKYRGLKKQDYINMNLPDMSFVHNAGFVAGLTSKQSAINFAVQILKEEGIIP